MPEMKLITFSNTAKEDRTLLKRFVRFHWDHYREDPQHIPLLDYEYLGKPLFGLVGFFEPHNLFYRHAEIVFFLAERDGEIVGRNCAFVNRRHNKHWNDKVGFFGQFESIDDNTVAGTLLDAAAKWLRERGMDTVRGPQSFPVNEATPGVLIDGFDSRPVIYYPYNKPYYEKLFRGNGFGRVKKIFSWEYPVINPIEEKLKRIGELAEKRGKIRLEKWNDRPLTVRKREMREIYNEAWSNNFGFVPFTEDEFNEIVDEMKMIIDKNLFIFAYLGDEAAGFFGGVPNILEKMEPAGLSRHFEFFRAAKMFLGASRTAGFRLGYLGVKKKFRNLGLEAYLLYKQHLYTREKGYEYIDIGWVLEDNTETVKLVHMLSHTRLSKTYAVMEKQL